MSKTETQSEALRLAAKLRGEAENSIVKYSTAHLAAKELERLDAENKALRADAERYHHLRDCNSGSIVVMQITGTGEDDWHVLTEGDADEAIDAAMAAAKTGDAA